MPGAVGRESPNGLRCTARFAEAGKRIQFFTSQDPLGWRSLDVLADQLGSAKGIMMYGEAPIEEESQIRVLLNRYGIG